MKKVCIIGHFGGGNVFLDGQTIKTKTWTEELKNVFGANQVSALDTYGGKKALLRCLCGAWSALKGHENVVMLPAQNGVRFFAPALLLGNLFFRRKLHYAVIGGWLPEYLQAHKRLQKQLKKFHFIYVETSVMKNALEQAGFENVSVVPNCKQLPVLKEQDLVYADSEPYRLCTFSRIMPEKGIEDAVRAVQSVNRQLGRTVYTLTIYGQVDDSAKRWFKELTAHMPAYISYGGLVPYDESVDVLKDYFALLFPTKFYTEGVPGTIIDAYAAGVPVICAKWQNFWDIVKDGVTGIGYEFGEETALEACLKRAAENAAYLNEMKIHCLKKASSYLPVNVLKETVTKW